jgi:hypothetical protein
MKPLELRRLCNMDLRLFLIFVIRDKRVEEAVVTWFIIVSDEAHLGERTDQSYNNRHITA